MIRSLLPLVVCLLMLLLIGCRRATSEYASKTIVTSSRRASKVECKGMELYAWKPEGKDWRFSLIFGTNRTKRLAEITSPEYIVVGVENLKRKLAVLAVGESVLWSNRPGELDKSDWDAWGKMASEPVPSEIVGELTAYCTSLGIKMW